MKLFAALSVVCLSLLVQQCLSTHLETCECEEIQKLATVQEAVAGLEEKMDSISSAVSQFNATARNFSGITEAMKQLLKPIQQQLDYHLPPPPVENPQQTRACATRKKR